MKMNFSRITPLDATKIFLAALLINSLLLFIAYAKDIKTLLNSTVNFGIVISGDGGGDPPPVQHEKPQNIAPANNTAITMPFAFSMSPFQQSGGQYQQTEIVFWRLNETDGPPPLQIVTTIPPNGFQNFLVTDDVFQPGETYVWRVRHKNANNVWSEFSDSTVFFVQTPVVATYSGGGISATYSSGGDAVTVPAMTFESKTRDGLSVTNPKQTAPAPTQAKKGAKTSSRTSKSPRASPQVYKQPAVREPPARLKIEKKAIPKKGALEIKFAPQGVQKKKTVEAEIRIKKKGGGTVFLIRKKEAFRTDKAPQKKNISEVKKLGVGGYTSVLSYEDGGTIFSFEEDFEIVEVPFWRNPRFPAVFLWNEAILIVAIMVASLFLTLRKKHV